MTIFSKYYIKIVYMNPSKSCEIGVCIAILYEFNKKNYME